MLKIFLIVFFISMVPLIELRGAIPVGVALFSVLLGVAEGQMLPVKYIVLINAVSMVGNMLPVPFIYFTDRNCHFEFFAVLGQNSVFSPNYDCFRKSNQNFPATPTPRSVIPVYFCRQPLIRANATKLTHITSPRSHINSDFEVLS